jgi:hypothetical protein
MAERNPVRLDLNFFAASSVEKTWTRIMVAGMKVAAQDRGHRVSLYLINPDRAGSG